MRGLVAFVGAVVVGWSLAGCGVARTTIVSNKGETATLAARRVFLSSHLSDPRDGPIFGDGFAGAFEDRMGTLLRRCGADLLVDQVNGPATDEAELGRRLDAHRPEQVLVVRKAGSGRSAVGLLYRVDLGATLLEVTAAPGGALKPVWKAFLTASPSDHSFGIRGYADDGADVADALVRQLQKDGFYPGCVTADPPKAPAQKLQPQP